VMVRHTPFVQLKYQLTAGNQTLILRPAVRAPTAKQSLVPTTTCLDVLHANERLWMHEPSQSIDKLSDGKAVKCSAWAARSYLHSLLRGSL
jgi:hypothetical protein